jgi:hypothetical protein
VSPKRPRPPGQGRPPIVTIDLTLAPAAGGNGGSRRRRGTLPIVRASVAHSQFTAGRSGTKRLTKLKRQGRQAARSRGLRMCFGDAVIAIHEHQDPQSHMGRTDHGREDARRNGSSVAVTTGSRSRIESIQHTAALWITISEKLLISAHPRLTVATRQQFRCSFKGNHNFDYTSA